MPIVEQDYWEKQVVLNKDAYGKCCVDVARRVMEILDNGKDFDTHKIINQAAKEVQADGITGFMAGCVAEMISICHSRGDEFRKKWNESYGVTEDKAKGKGVVNPALVTIDI